MRAQRLEMIGITLSEAPATPDAAVRKDYVDALVSGAPVFITDITPSSTGIVGLKEYEAGTVPSDVVLTDATSDTQNIRVYFLADSPGTSYSPTLTADVGGVGSFSPDSMTELANTPRMFEGYFDLTITQNETINITSSSGATASADVIYGADGPEAVSFTIGALPGSQTELKQGDVVSYSGTAPNDAVDGTVQNSGAAQSGTVVLGADDSAGAGFKTLSGSFTVGSNSGLQNLVVVLENTLGTNGDPVNSTNQVTLNQTYPTIGTLSYTYPAGQSALKGSETVTIDSTVTNADTVDYTSSANLTVTSPTVYNVSKTVTRIGGNYVNGVDNYTITANKASNDATTVVNGQVTIANVAPTAAITISGSPSRLRSSAAGEDYTVQITANQVLDEAPSLTAGSGTWQGSWTLNGSTWERDLRIDDTDTKGAQSFSSIALPSIAGDSLDGTVISSGSAYTVGGFLARQITFAAFSQYEAIGTSVVDINKTECRYVGVEPDLTLRNDTNNVTQSYTITDSGGTYNATGNYVFINDVDFANSNTSGTLLVEIEEVE